MWARPPPSPPPPAYRGPPASSAYVFTGIIGVLALLYLVQQRDLTAEPRWLPSVGTEKREYEVWVLRYSVFWMGTFGVVVAFQLYEMFDAAAYFTFCGGLALPLLLQPVLARTSRGLSAPSMGAQHAARAQLWVAIFGFIGNYWCAPTRMQRTSRTWPKREPLHGGCAGTHTTFIACSAQSTPCPRGGSTTSPSPCSPRHTFTFRRTM